MHDQHRQKYTKSWINNFAKLSLPLLRVAAVASASATRMCILSTALSRIGGHERTYVKPVSQEESSSIIYKIFFFPNSSGSSDPPLIFIIEQVAQSLGLKPYHSAHLPLPRVPVAPVLVVFPVIIIPRLPAAVPVVAIPGVGRPVGTITPFAFSIAFGILAAPLSGARL